MGGPSPNSFGSKNEILSCSTTDSELSETMEITNLSDAVSHPYKNPIAFSLNGGFLSIEAVLHAATEVEHMGSSIPRGVKENVYFVLDDTQNVERRQSGKVSEYPDDCGAWASSKNSTKTNYYIRGEDGKLKYVEFKNGVYCLEQKRKFIPITPNPLPNPL